jgi:hypothetical protein
MIFQTQELLFFTLNDCTAISFERYVRFTGKEYVKNSEFRYLRQPSGDPITFKHLLDLEYFIEGLPVHRIANLLIIIDQYSLDLGDNRTLELLDEIILLYPEVKITFLSCNDDWVSLFDSHKLECQIEKPEKCSHDRCESCKNYRSDDGRKGYDRCSVSLVLPYIHSFDLGKLLNADPENISGSNGPEPFTLLVRGQSNMFDASNLRNLVKQRTFDKITTRSNFAREQCSRAHNKALVAEEELSQAYTAAYGMYVMGYSVLPVVSAAELKYLQKKKTEAWPSWIILRDYDLQYEDYKEVRLDLYHLRGLMRVDSHGKSIDQHNDDKYWKWDRCDDIWGKMPFSKVGYSMFLSRFDVSDKKINPQICQPKLFNRLNDGFYDKNLGIAVEKSSKQKALLNGLAKPLDGIYELLDVPQIRSVWRASQTQEPFDYTRSSVGGHSTPPFTFHIAQNLINRAQQYYDEKLYLPAALLAREALEILNGFHFILMLEAVYIYAVAETCLDLDSMGINEDRLATNSVFRLKSLNKLVERICKDNPKARRSVLSQIFNDIKLLNRSQEQFKSGDVALNELINARFGITRHRIKEFFRNELRQFKP